MKNNTDLEQSKKLAEILPLESADMWWNFYSVTTDNTTPQIIHIDTPWVGSFNWNNKPDNIPCWSFAALLDILEYPQLSKDKLGSGKEGWMVSVYPNGCRYDSCWHDNPIDCCVEMICKLYENVEVKQCEFPLFRQWEWDSERGCSYPPCQISK